MSNELSHYGVLGMKWGVRKTNKLSSFKLVEKTVDLDGTPSKHYRWMDSDNKIAAEFKTFDWWDGKNLCDLEVNTNYRKQGLSYELLDYATKKLKCKNLAVEKNNTVAKHVYDKYGFEVTDKDGERYYMSLKEQTQNDQLMHYGVLGMKWGKRKSSSSSKTKTDISKLSDDDLRKRINRMQMEKQYKQLSGSSVDKGKKIVQDLLVNTAKAAAIAVITKNLTQGVDVVVNSGKKAAAKNAAAIILAQGIKRNMK